LDIRREVNAHTTLWTKRRAGLNHKLKKSKPHLEQLPDLLQDIIKGLLYTHTRINANTTRTLEAASFLYAHTNCSAKKRIFRSKSWTSRTHNATNTLSSMKLKLTARAGGIYAKQYAVSFLLPCQGRMWWRVLSDGNLAGLI
jgi:hypothetical protein